MLTSKNRASLYGAFPQNGQGRSQTKKTKEIARKRNTYTSQSVIWNSILLALPQLSFFTALPMSITFHLQSSGLLWVVTLWHVHSLRPVSPLVSCLATQAGTCSAGITHPLNLREGRLSWSPQERVPERGYGLACRAGSPNLGGHLHGRSALRVGRVGKENSNECYFGSSLLEPKW